VNVILSAGTYWLAVAPDVANQNSYVTTTSGANAVGLPAGERRQLFFSSNFSVRASCRFDPSNEGAGTWDYSMGIIGTADQITPVPEPAG